MKAWKAIKGRVGFPLLYELMVWVFYVGTYKYSYYLDELRGTPPARAMFPHPVILLYACALTLYILPFYRWLVPKCLSSKKYGTLAMLTILFLWIVPKFNNRLIGSIFLYCTHDPTMVNFYKGQLYFFRMQATHVIGWDLKILFTDFVVFSSVAAMRYSFEAEGRKRLLEQDNLQLQLEALKAQLNPHFLFNTLNSIYGMSLVGSTETPSFILRLSHMMRYILYDCRHGKVPVEKDVEFLQDYFEMEKKRYPNAGIRLEIKGHTEASVIAPLLLIPFVENSFKHGAHRLNDKGFVDATILINDESLEFTIENDIFNVVREKERYGGVGIDNVRGRLALYYPHSHELKITHDNNRYNVTLKIILK
jgi:sensor histidine kinase YesM